MNNENKNLYQSTNLINILDTKENRANYRKSLINKYKKPLLVFSFNIPYNKKNSNLINFNFNTIASKIIWAMSDSIIYCDIKYDDNGNALFIVFDKNPSLVKKLFTNLEEKANIGRLLDIDIYDTNNNKLSRNKFRKCFICNKPAFECARSNSHTQIEINQYVEKLLYENFKDTLSCQMANAIFDELYTTPKPGLVDLNNNGSHKDLNVKLFKKSIKTISKFFPTIIDITYNYIKNNNIKYKIDNKNNDLNNNEHNHHNLYFCSKHFTNLFNILQNEGKKIEEAMFTATNNINTHKGVLYFSILILAANTISIFSPYKYDCHCCFFEDISFIIKKLVSKNYNNAKKQSAYNPSTHGENVYKKYKIFGIREEAYNGIPNIFSAENYLMNFIDNFNNVNNYFIKNSNCYNNIVNDLDINIYNNLIYPLTLIYIISNIKDTNLIHRGGLEGLEYAQYECKKIINDNKKHLKNNLIDNIYSLDKNFIQKNLSPGGSADILSMAIYFSKITNLFLYL